MKNKIYLYFVIFFLNFIICSISLSSDQFNFNVTEIEILENGNLVKGSNRGTITTDDGLILNANSFVYNKISNILEAQGNVKIEDNKQNIKIFADTIIYNKNDEIILTNKNSKAIYDISKILYADKFKFIKKENILNAEGNVRAEDISNKYFIKTDELTYFKNEEKIITKGVTNSKINSKYEIKSKDVVFFPIKNELSSNKKTEIKDKNSQVFYLNKFNFLIDDEVIKGEKILIVTNYNLPKSDKFFFDNAIIDLKNKKFVGKDTDIRIHKSIFDNSENDPRLKGVSAKIESDISIINKGIFTSCKENDNCPPWSLMAEKITHDKTKKQLMYDSAILKIYDFPVLYFPKFFHPDPTVERQTGFLKPELNNSSVLGSSISIPYFNIISENKDFTIKPVIFDSNVFMANTEYRQANEFSNFIADFGYVKNYKSTTFNKRKDLSHLFAEFDFDLNFKNFISSDLHAKIEKVTSDSYLKIFNSYITKSEVRPENLDKLNSNVKIFLNHEDYNFEGGIEVYEDLNTSKNDRFQYIFPYYNFDKSLSKNYYGGYLNFSSIGSNDLNNTNELKTSIINDLVYNSKSFISDNGFKSEYSINLKNINSIGKNSSNYKSTPQIELVSLLNAELSLPMIKNTGEYTNLLTPKMSLRINPGDMKNYSSSLNKIDVGNIFSTNRLGLTDTLEAGRSLTIGLDFKREKSSLEDINKYFEFKIATVLRDKEEKFISKKSTLNKKTSNIFGSLDSKISEKINIGYNFSIDNDLNNIEYNDVNATFSLNNVVTKFNFIKESGPGEIGDSNVLESSISYTIDDQNSLKFNTRRNRKISLTEYYDLVYEYKNDCLTAGIKYNKTYYSDGDLKPTENLFFTLTLFPLTTYEYKANEILSN